MIDRKTALVILNMIPGLGPVSIRKLLNVCSDPVRILLDTPKEIKSMLNDATFESIRNWNKIKWKEEIEKAQSFGLKIVSFEEPGYPDYLRDIPDPPIVLYIKGNIPYDKVFIAVVGTRNPSFYGASMAEKFASELSQYGFCIVSGLARGIDSISHKAALKLKNPTLAVLGSGLGNIYPPENKKLAEEITQNGAIVSEFPIDTPPEKFNFPRRNRIISGLSIAVVVIEAGLRSGALITAHLAADQNKDVFVLPSDINRITGKGNNLLIKEGAFLVESVAEIIEQLGLQQVKENSVTQKIIPENLTEDEKLVYNVIMGKKTTFTEIQAITGISTEKLIRILTALEVKGLINSFPGHVYEDKNLNGQNRGEK
ncbi:MAG: DNA-processing protein DprA [Candidatus Omnitrophica bacterium]|nr:DNA-processing protein DprA [Candidatus Omnitrophota bacterium]